MIRFKRLIKSFTYACKGLFKIFKEEQNLQLQSIIAIVVIILGSLWQINRLEWAFLIIAIGLVVICEIINSAVERITDVLKPRINSYVKEIKDIMAAAVMVSSLLAIIIGIIILGPYLINLFKCN